MKKKKFKKLISQFQIKIDQLEEYRNQLVTIEQDVTAKRKNAERDINNLFKQMRELRNGYSGLFTEPELPQIEIPEPVTEPWG